MIGNLSFQEENTNESSCCWPRLKAAYGHEMSGHVVVLMKQVASVKRDWAGLHL